MHGTVILREVGQGFDPINYGLVTSMLLFLLFIRSSVLQIIFDALLTNYSDGIFRSVHLLPVT